VTILLSGSPHGGSVAGSSSLADQRPFFFLLKSIFLFCLFGSAQRHHQGATLGVLVFLGKFNHLFTRTLPFHSILLGDVTLIFAL
jgi:hypothetical protein